LINSIGDLLDGKHPGWPDDLANLNLMMCPLSVFVSLLRQKRIPREIRFLPLRNVFSRACFWDLSLYCDERRRGSEPQVNGLDQERIRAIDDIVDRRGFCIHGHGTGEYVVTRRQMGHM
jgi:hypothetical protein